MRKRRLDRPERDAQHRRSKHHPSIGGLAESDDAARRA